MLAQAEAQLRLPNPAAALSTAGKNISQLARASENRRYDTDHTGVGLIEDTSNDTEKMVEVSLDSLSLTWGTAWEASHMSFVTQNWGCGLQDFVRYWTSTSSPQLKWCTSQNGHRLARLFYTAAREAVASCRILLAGGGNLRALQVGSSVISDCQEGWKASAIDERYLWGDHLVRAYQAGVFMLRSYSSL